MEKRAEIQEYLKQNLSYIRYSHSLRVERTAVRIARQVGVDEYPCLIAGLAHDICREKIDSEIFTILGENSIIDNKFKRSNPLLLHGFAGAVLLAEKFLINDTSI
ncbi:MAG: HD domain-containing protein, partial [bacterium]|nr:HD domain-containing protein [bacterium]